LPGFRSISRDRSDDDAVASVLRVGLWVAAARCSCSGCWDTRCVVKVEASNDEYDLVAVVVVDAMEDWNWAEVSPPRLADEAPCITLLLTGVLVLPSAVAGNAVDDDAKYDNPSAAPDLMCIGRLWLSLVARAFLLLRCESRAAAAASEAAREGITEDGVFADRAGVAPDNAKYAVSVEDVSPISFLVDDRGLAEAGGAGGAVVDNRAAADEEDVTAPDVGGFLLVELRYDDDMFRASSGVCNAGLRSRLAMAVVRRAIAGVTPGSDSAADAGGDAPSPSPPPPLPPLLPCRRRAAASRRAMAAADVSREGGCWLLIVSGIYRLAQWTTTKQPAVHQPVVDGSEVEHWSSH
jgi:hypothetical protein